MQFWKKTFPFLILNVLVSAAAMLLVLWLWQGKIGLPTQPTMTPAVTRAVMSAQPDVPEETKTVMPLSTGVLTIEGVFGAGDLNVEYVLIRNQSGASVNLSGWKVGTDQGGEYALPQLTLNQDGAVRLYSKHGSNTVIELFWNSDQALWSSGSQVFLVDPAGERQASWQVP